MLTKKDRIKNKSGIFANYRIEYTLKGEDDVHVRYFNAQSEDHALKMLEDMLARQNTTAEVHLIEVDWIDS